MLKDDEDDHDDDEDDDEPGFATIRQSSLREGKAAVLFGRQKRLVEPADSLCVVVPLTELVLGRFALSVP